MAQGVSAKQDSKLNFVNGIFSAVAGKLRIARSATQNDTTYVEFDASGVTGDRVYTLPDANSTLAAVANVVANSNYVSNGVLVGSGAGTYASVAAVSAPTASAIVRRDANSKASFSNIALTLSDHADDAAAAIGGVSLGELYHTSGAVKIRLV